MERNEDLTGDDLGYLRLAAVSPSVRVADVAHNTRATVEALERVAARGCRLAVFPELGLTGYTCADLFHQEVLLDAAEQGLREVLRVSRRLGVAAVVGLPVRVGGRLYNCAALVSGGRLAGVVPKVCLPTAGEYYEQRWFTSGALRTHDEVEIAGRQAPFGEDLVFTARNLPGCAIGVEICEDLWTPQPASGRLALGGATVLVNPSASNELAGKARRRRDLVREQAARCAAAYVYAAAGPGESSTDVVFGGHSMIAENGVTLAESRRFGFETEQVVTDVDLQHLNAERARGSGFSSSTGGPLRRVDFHLPRPDSAGPAPGALRPVPSRTPFVPEDPDDRAEHCFEAFTIQTTALCTRLRHLTAGRGGRGPVVSIGLSGGLDSTLALLVAAASFDRLVVDRRGIVAVTMPGPGTTSRTRGNAEALARLLGVTCEVVPIGESTRHHLGAIGHSGRHDATFQNAQARERTRILMDVAGLHGGFNLGTGDLSELALGYCTFNGDHMSMYHVNAGVPKTLVRQLVEWCADNLFDDETAAVLRDICATPSTAELLPPTADGRSSQTTEEIVGPDELQDFFLFHTVRSGFSPTKVFRLAERAFDGRYTPEQILKWMGIFYYAFFNSQYKRSAMPDGPKVTVVGLSPRADWRMPSDAVSTLWLREIADLRALSGKERVDAAQVAV
ncbi:NAD+ synthase (glutamine-hydrolysing) [Lentzea fradiae]|uniref:Glutamine-dependent NAD(+) synthetase n=1 Tax=Lentzea fradiae TaxID=200378 RepID=A0A1G8BH69_9PSEU|nr:NAD(+) synthase [Lentzea fradiae]SDH32363.1 NAD+ synthase (glutamine-hydrolysing) [Lentzea fradiae]